MLNVKRVADLLGYKPTRVYELTKEPLRGVGVLPAVRMGNGRLLFVEADVQKWLAKRMSELGR